MTSLENVVRPFETKQIRPGTLTVGRSNPPPDSVVLNCGSPDGSATVWNASASASITTYTEDSSRETTREVVPMRIMNEDDKTQHVDVEVTQKMTTVETAGDTTTRKERTFAEVQAADNAVITGPTKKLDSEKPKKDKDKPPPKDGW